MKHATWNVLATLVFAALAGCNSGPNVPDGVIVKGTIVKGDKPLVVPRQDVGLGSVLVRLVPAASPGKGDPESALADANGRFQIRSKGRGVPPGKYRLAVLQQDRGPGSDMLRGAFSDAKSPIEVDVPADKVGGTHDMGKIDLDQVKKP